MKTTVLISRHHKSGDLSRYSHRFTLPITGTDCSCDWFSTVTDAERSARAFLAQLGHVPEFEYSPGLFN